MFQIDKNDYSLMGLHIIICLIVGVIILPSSTQAQSTTAAFHSPAPNSTVRKCYDYRIQMLELDASKHYWMVHEVNGLHWPKLKINLLPGESIVEGNMCESARRYGILVFETKTEDQQKLLEWFNNCTKSGKCPGMIMPGRTIGGVRVHQ